MQAISSETEESQSGEVMMAADWKADSHQWGGLSERDTAEQSGL